MFADHPLLRRFENELDVNGFQLEWTKIERDFYSRPKGANVEIVWWHSGRGGCYESDLLRSKRAIVESTAHKIIREIANFQVWRAAFLDDCDLFFRADFGVVRLKGKVGGEQEFARFALPTAFSSPHKCLSSSLELRRVIEDSLAEIERLKMILKQPPESRVWWSISWNWGTQQELEKLLRAMAILVRQPQHELEEWYYQLRSHFQGQVTPFPHHSAPSIHLDSFRPFLNHLKLCTPCKISFTTIYDIHNIASLEPHYWWPSLNLSTKMPTAHEKIEAWMLWQDFLTGKIPTAEIKKLRDSISF